MGFLLVQQQKILAPPDETIFHHALPLTDDKAR